MLLAIDAGNTNVVFAIFDRDVLSGSWRTSTDIRRTADEYAVWLTQLMGLKGLSAGHVDACIIASVVPDALFALKRLSEAYFDVQPEVLGETPLGLGIRVRLTRPEELGADRLADAVAASALWTPPLIIVDFGTATTFDVIDASGDYVGGAIAPGVNLSLDALSSAAAKLPRVAIQPTRRVVGDNTIAAMQSGIFWGYVGLVEGLVARIQAEFEAPMRVVATGGLAALFSDVVPAISAVEPDLTLIGLRLIHERNAKNV